MPGGPSHIDLFDPKPRVAAMDGRPLPFEKPRLERVKTGNLLASPWKFKKHGECGTEISELLPCIATHADDLCVIRSMVADNINHTGAALQMNTGEQAFSRPSLGSWLVYGLGTENQNLPAFVVVSPAAVFQGAQLWSSSFLPSAYQGTLIRDLNHPIANLSDPSRDASSQRAKLDAIGELNRLHKRGRVMDGQLDARIASFELAFRMQRDAPEAFDIERESAMTRRLYGVGEPTTDLFGRQCLLARRLLERGVRYVQLFDAPANNAWDHHSGLRENLPKRCAAVDRPIAALLHDLKGAGCSTTPWSCGAENSAARRLPRGRTGASTIPSGSPCGWPGEASDLATSTGLPMNSAGTPCKTRSTSTTCTRRSCTSWASNTSD